MRWAVRFALTASIVSIILLLILKQHLEDLWDQYNVPAYLRSSFRNSFSHGELDHLAPVPGTMGDKIIIMAKLEHEKTDWVAKNLPESAPLILSTTIHVRRLLKLTNSAFLCSWQHAIYTVNPASPTTLSTPLNKGHESMAYLSYIIDHYTSLPATLAFLHSHRSGFFAAWHTDTALHDNVEALRALQLPFVQSNGYVNLRCNWNPGCLEAHRNNKHVTPDVWRDVFAGTTTFILPSNSSSPSSSSPPHSRDLSHEAPAQVGAACCAQFAVSRERVLQRPLSDYEKIRQWIIDTEKSDAQSGRVMEFLWHVIFGMDAV
ncbi:hypothetical protein MMC07_002563 [Pseudocyphellaria aurata]|nr:hypothetical protein [Pseudocyphellaria aurata]